MDLKVPIFGGEKWPPPDCFRVSKLGTAAMRSREQSHQLRFHTKVLRCAENFTQWLGG